MAQFAIANILLCGTATNEGRFESSPDSYAWSSKNSDKRIVVKASDLKSASWYDLARACQLWLTDGKGQLHRFEGFKQGDFERIATAIQASSNVKLQKKELSSKGRSFGGVRINGNNLELLDDVDSLIAPIPLTSIGLAAAPGKNEVEIQCIDDDTVEREDECLVEMKLYVPEEANVPGVEAFKNKRKASKSSSADGEDEEDEGELSTSAALHAMITEAAGIRGVTGDALVELPEDAGSFLVPRGRFAIEFYPQFLRLIGSSYEFKVQYKSIARVTYLPLPASSGTWADATRYAIVISLDDPLRQGNQRHPHLVLQLENREFEASIKIPAEDRKAGKYEGLGADGAESVRGPLPKVVGSLLKKIAGKPVFKPESFESAGKQRAVRCTFKSQQGLLFPLDKSMMWIHKPTVWIRYAEIESAEVQRFEGGAASSSKSWDLAIKCRAVGSEAAREYVFQSMDKSEKQPLIDFFKARNIKVLDQDLNKRSAKVNYAELDGEEAEDEDEDEDEDSEDDEDFQDNGGDDDDDEASADSDDSGSGSEDDDDDDGGKGSGSDESEGAGFKRRRKTGGGKKSSKKAAPSSSKSKSKGKGKEKKKSKKRKGSDSDDE